MPISTPLATDDAIAIRGRILAPSLMSPFAEDMGRRLSRLSLGPLLEIMADTGSLTQVVASAMSAGMPIIATDPSAAAIEYASARSGMARVAWQQADPGLLPFKDATFGIVACHFGFVTVADRIKAFAEARRVARTGGRLMFSVPAHLRHNEIAACVQEVMDDLFPSDAPAFLRRVLHGYADTETIDDDLTAAGFTDAVYSTLERPFVAASARDAAIGYCLGTPLRTEIEARAPGEAERIADATAAALARRFGHGAIQAGMRVHIISASG